MNGQDYLDKIAATSRPGVPAKAGGSWPAKLWANRFFKVGAIGVVGLILIVIVGLIVGGGSSPKEQTYRLMLHLNNTGELISEYQPSVKSSELRSSSASLAGVLANTSRELMTYVTEKFNYKSERDIDEKLTEQAKLEMDGLNSELFEAKINGLLDRIYAHKMAYEISAFMSEESSLYSATSDDSLRTLLKTSYDSLENLYSKFNDFSETK